MAAAGLTQAEIVGTCFPYRGRTEHIPYRKANVSDPTAAPEKAFLKEKTKTPPDCSLIRKPITASRLIATLSWRFVATRPLRPM
jgi:hypothetical protein